jgi:hypothetical protein
MMDLLEREYHKLDGHLARYEPITGITHEGCGILAQAPLLELIRNTVFGQDEGYIFQGIGKYMERDAGILTGRAT